MVGCLRRLEIGYAPPYTKCRLEIPKPERKWPSLLQFFPLSNPSNTYRGSWKSSEREYMSWAGPSQSTNGKPRHGGAPGLRNHGCPISWPLSPWRAFSVNDCEFIQPSPFSWTVRHQILHFQRLKTPPANNECLVPCLGLKTTVLVIHAVVPPVHPKHTPTQQCESS